MEPLTLFSLGVWPTGATIPTRCDSARFLRREEGQSRVPRSAGVFIFVSQQSTGAFSPPFFVCFANMLGEDLRNQSLGLLFVSI